MCAEGVAGPGNRLGALGPVRVGREPPGVLLLADDLEVAERGRNDGWPVATPNFPDHRIPSAAWRVEDESVRGALDDDGALKSAAVTVGLTMRAGSWIAVRSCSSRAFA